MRKRAQSDDDEVKVDMTPMIDVVFNLIIFFMLVTQMVTLERAELELPQADQAQEDQSVDKKRLIINIHKNGRVEISGRIHTEEEVKNVLIEEAGKTSDRDQEGFSKRTVLIRADVETPYRFIQKIMEMCAKQKIYRISFGAKMEDGG